VHIVLPSLGWVDEKIKTGKMVRVDDVLVAIDGERAYQNRIAGEKHEHAGRRGVAEEILMMEEYLLLARAALDKGDKAVFDILRKVAGMIVRCFENNGKAGAHLMARREAYAMLVGDGKSLKHATDEGRPDVVQVLQVIEGIIDETSVKRRVSGAV